MLNAGDGRLTPKRHKLTQKFPLEYRAWQSAKTRCYNTRCHNFALYGGRGIYMVEEWRTDFARFLADMGAKPANASLDRIDNNGPYGPANCRWATHKEQSRNTRTNRLLTFRGQTHTMTEWAVLLGTTDTTLCSRLKMGWTVDRALSSNIRSNRLLTHDGQTHTVAEWARRRSLRPGTLLRRLMRGWTPALALETPIHHRLH